MNTEDFRLSKDLVSTIREYLREKEGCHCEIDGQTEPMHVILCNDLPNIAITCLGCGTFFDIVDKEWQVCCEPLERYSRYTRTEEDSYFDEKEGIIL